MHLSFEKYHGIGNDFLVISAQSDTEISVSQAMELCKQHYGVGGDGVLVVSPAQTKGARATMSVINADGSTPEMCGNGLRCVALHLARQSEEETVSFVVDTGAGPLLCEVQRNGNQAMVATDIGVGTPLPGLPFTFQDETLSFARISTGNPHAICFRPQLSDAQLDELGPQVSGAIEGGANVEIATKTGSQEITLKVWERGVGRTLACGTGAAATAIAAVDAGHCQRDQPVFVTLPGGTLEITVDEERRAKLRGPATWVFSGQIEI